MNAKDLMNMDMETAIQWLLHGWHWWIDELMSMLPPEWRERLVRRSHVIAEINKSGSLVYRDEESNQPFAAKPRGPIKFLVPANHVLTREIELPLLPMSDVKRMIALDIDRRTPRGRGARSGWRSAASGVRSSSASGCGKVFGFRARE